MVFTQQPSLPGHMGQTITQPLPSNLHLILTDLSITQHLYHPGNMVVTITQQHCRLGLTNPTIIQLLHLKFLQDHMDLSTTLLRHGHRQETIIPHHYHVITLPLNLHFPTNPIRILMRSTWPRFTTRSHKHRKLQPLRPLQPSQQQQQQRPEQLDHHFKQLHPFFHQGTLLEI